jgi:hopanoid biosynthesis associated protein HpnK
VRGAAVKKIIVTGDDFGLAVPINEAIVEAHRRGILTAASLMVGADSAQDAVEKARAHPSLQVGLHVVLVEGRPVLPAHQVPGLVDENGEFSNHFVRAGLKFFFKRGIRQQLEAEIRAQFEMFRKTGLILDHVDAHNHMHFHPTILRLIVKVGKEYGMRALRIPSEPPLPSWRASGKSPGARFASSLFLSPLVLFMRSSLRRNQILCNDHFFGLHDSGAMTEKLVGAIMKRLPEGVTELGFHPATRRCPEIDRTMPNYMHTKEFEALTSPSLARLLEEAKIGKIAFSDLHKTC